MRTTVITVVALGFFAIVASIAFDWPAKQWLALVGYALFAIGVAIGLVRRLVRSKRPSGGGSSELSASDEYSDLELGRRPFTHYPRDDASTSQIGDPPQHRLPSI